MSSAGGGGPETARRLRRWGGTWSEHESRADSERLLSSIATLRFPRTWACFAPMPWWIHALLLMLLDVAAVIWNLIFNKRGNTSSEIDNVKSGQCLQGLGDVQQWAGKLPVKGVGFRESFLSPFPKPLYLGLNGRRHEAKERCTGGFIGLGKGKGGHIENVFSRSCLLTFIYSTFEIWPPHNANKWTGDANMASLAEAMTAWWTETRLHNIFAVECALDKSVG